LEKGSQRSERRRFGLQFTLGMVLLSGILYWKHGGFFPGIWIPLGLGAFHLAGSILLPVLLAPTHWFLPRLVSGITKAFSFVFLALFYYLVFTPVALLLRSLGKDHIGTLEKSRPAWQEVPSSENDPARIEKLY